MRLATQLALFALVSTPSLLAAEPARTTALAKGSFEVKLKPEGEPQAHDGVSLGRMTFDKVFSGDIVGTSRGTMLTAMTATEGSAGYVAFERVSGTLHGKSGSFVFQHSGIMNRGTQKLSITLVPDSGTGELAGIDGTFKLTIVEGKHLYEFQYSLVGASAVEASPRR